MRFAVITANIPNPATSVGAMTPWTILKTMVESGHKVTAILLLYPSDPYIQERESRLAALSGLGIEIIEVEVNLPRLHQNSKEFELIRKVLRPTIEDFYPTVSLVPKMENILKEIRPDAIFIYNFEGLAATHGLRVAPRMVGVGDPPHLPGFYRWCRTPPRLNYNYLHYTLSVLSSFYYHPKFIPQLLNDCEVVGAFAAQHADQICQWGVANCLYLRTPIPDLVGPGWQQLRHSYRPQGKPKILMIGHLAGTATRSGLYLFAKRVLPILERELEEERFEVHIVGGFVDLLPSDLAEMLARPSVHLRGHIEPADFEFLSSDVFLVPTPIKLGARIRIIVGFSFGCCVVAHRSVVAGTPELIHGENILIAKSGRGLAEAVIRVLSDSALQKRLGANGRQTYEENFSPAVAGKKIVTELERIALECKK